MLRVDRKWQNSIKQLSFNKKIFFFKRKDPLRTNPKSRNPFHQGKTHSIKKTSHHPCPEDPHYPVSLSQHTSRSTHPTLIHSTEDFEQIFFPRVIHEGLIKEGTVGKGGDAKIESSNWNGDFRPILVLAGTHPEGFLQEKSCFPCKAHHQMSPCFILPQAPSLSQK